MSSKYYSHIDETLYSHQCNNGLKVFVIEKKEFTKTYGIFATNFGSCHNHFKINNKEIKVIDGSAHFLEHKMFEKEEYDVMDLFSKQSASCNAFTSFNKTAYLFSCTAYVNKNIETLLDFVQDIDISEDSVEKEKPIIASEINMYKDNVDWQTMYLSLASLYHNNPIKLDIAGSVESIYQINRDLLYKYYQAFYHPSNMILFICGNVNHQDVFNLVDTNQANKKFDDIKIELIRSNEPTSIVEDNIVKEMSINNQRLSYNFKINDFVLEPFKQDICMDILMNILFSEKSDFYLDLFNNKIITSDYYYSYSQDYILSYAFVSFDFISLDNDKLIRYLDNYFTKDLTKLISIEDFNIAKNKYIGDFIKLFNDPARIANTFISYYYLDYDLFKSIDLINEITFEDLNKVSSLFNSKYHTITNIVPKK
ncbi:MAG: insulinase family protein [Bacilli bacterium]|jgi:predicted Zn-dependent peptidase|nr:insulinase family protein [Bacilli bacterium]